MKFYRIWNRRVKLDFSSNHQITLIQLGAVSVTDSSLDNTTYLLWEW